MCVLTCTVYCHALSWCESAKAAKVLEIDRHSVMAIAGSPAIAWKMARILEHSFQFYRRSQLQEMSVEGKVSALVEVVAINGFSSEFYDFIEKGFFS